MNNCMLTLDEVCALLDKTPSTIKRYARENLLSSVKENEQLMFPAEEVHRYLAFSKKLNR
ncbi:DNA-binding protein [Shewanella mangrovi]|uniref:DNA-binding protein n=1 Tax=Shewanella mangrovi TaxID=1515746 RepID=A0A094JLY2_9GAMM|nr:helix-turn-helix domain-containing protein [Shewanella mangrovi]KFZ39064.1 DNA-binding protein [Shewanella mangrovi]